MTATDINRLAELIDEARHGEWRYTEGSPTWLVSLDGDQIEIRGEDVAAMLNGLLAIQRSICDVRMAGGAS